MIPIPLQDIYRLAASSWDQVRDRRFMEQMKRIKMMHLTVIWMKMSK